VPSPKQERKGASRETPPRVNVVQLSLPAESVEADELIPAS
jgi:hypothetical protein